MLCKYPYFKNPTVSKKALLLSDEARQAATPFPCGRCINCRINRSRLWSQRIMFETLTNKDNCFATLTYDDVHLPINCSLDPDDVTDFLKRLRHHYDKVRYYYSGEYGEKGGRPHYHIILFGVPYADEEVIKKEWWYGNVFVGDVTLQSARYVAGYVIKGMYKDNSYTKEYLKGRYPEFSRMSRRPGIGFDAIKAIGGKLKARDIDQRIKTVRVGGKNYKLGRYLQSVMDDCLGIDINMKEVEYWEYQQEIFDECFMEKGLFVDNFSKKFEEKRRQQEKRFKIFNRRNKL